MEISMQIMNLNASKTMIPTRFRFRQKAPSVKVNPISCKGRADHLCMPRGKPNYYKVLCLDDTENAGLDDIKKAYRSMVRRYHPDVCSLSSKDECTKRFLELQMAYETLSDPISRKMYDYELSFGVGNCLVAEERRSRFPREVWEKQLDGLKRRSHIRRQMMNNMYN